MPAVTFLNPRVSVFPCADFRWLIICVVAEWTRSLLRPTHSWHLQNQPSSMIHCHTHNRLLPSTFPCGFFIDGSNRLGASFSTDRIEFIWQGHTNISRLWHSKSLIVSLKQRRITSMMIDTLCWGIMHLCRVLLGLLQIAVTLVTLE